MQARFDAELKDSRVRHDTALKDLQLKHEALNQTHQSLLDTKREMESQIKEMNHLIERKEYEFNLT